jgi:hypothetical protein
VNNQVNSVVTGAFLVFVLLIVSANAGAWWQILVSKKGRPLREDAEVFFPSK